MRIHLGVRHPLVRYGITQVLKDVYDVTYMVSSETEGEWHQAMSKFAFDLVLLHEDLYETSIPQAFFPLDRPEAAPYLKLIMYRKEQGQQQLLFDDHLVDGIFHEEADIDQLMLYFDRVRKGERLKLSSVFDDALDVNNGKGTPLTAREEEVFQLKVKGFSVNDTAKKLTVSPKTVENHRRNIKKKLSIKKGQDWYDWAKRIGYIR
ncbi:helix-turn-helix transcriptional regulator [Salisediminibacterium selenitireducens]|uniref:Transcriptional regulator, LuxR family n=1 Tax=Bacillus selenitireducens (strain ATCC 700615 / DSM 15326 / MLS10) TaxID=439292 RepID=D6XX30_BACIE|nr:response regulator transcription factor [Salisediminibacterium selenitireducens]ADI00007.1 transcriptional regulator, LuxR family [[Bacillus] selenitireducens MLS10]